jgi:hypothetical protein
MQPNKASDALNNASKTLDKALHPKNTASQKQKFILFTLGRLQQELNKSLEEKHLQIFIPKYVFIELVQKAAITEKKSRALYKNLEALEKNKYISYKGNNLALTNKGKKLYAKIYRQHEPYLKLIDILSKTDLMKYSKKSQTSLVVE